MERKNSDARQSTEYSGKTVAEALKRAAEELGMSAEQLEYEVVKDSSHSILGFVRTGEAIIRVFRPISDQVAETAKPVAAPETAVTPTSIPTVAVHPTDTEAEDSATSLKGNPPELEKVASEVVSTLLDKMDVMAAVEVADKGGQVDAASGEVSPMVLNLVGDDLGVLIGRRGETLRDLQFIARLIISRHLKVWPNLVLDVESYKARRVTALQAMATRMADQVRQTHRSIVLEPMPAHERRIIHLALRDDPDVYTESTGEDEDRKVQILPR